MFSRKTRSKSSSLDQKVTTEAPENPINDETGSKLAHFIDRITLEESQKVAASLQPETSELGFCQSLVYGMLYSKVFGVTTIGWPLEMAKIRKPLFEPSPTRNKGLSSSSLVDSSLSISINGNGGYDACLEASVESNAQSFSSEEKTEIEARSLPIALRFFLDPDVWYDPEKWKEEKRKEFDGNNVSDVPWAKTKIERSQMMKQDLGVARSLDSQKWLEVWKIQFNGQQSETMHYLPRYETWVEVKGQVREAVDDSKSEYFSYRKRNSSFSGFPFSHLLANSGLNNKWRGREFSPKPNPEPERSFPFPFDYDELFGGEHHEKPLLLDTSESCDGRKNSSFSQSDSPHRISEGGRKRRRHGRRLSIDSAREDLFRLSTCEEDCASLFDPLSSATRRAKQSRDFLADSGKAFSRGSNSSGYRSDLLSSTDQSLLLRQSSWADLTDFGRLRAGTIAVERPCQVQIPDARDFGPGFFSLPDSQANGDLQKTLFREEFVRNAATSVDPSGADLPDITTLRYFYNLGVTYYLEQARREQSHNTQFLESHSSGQRSMYTGGVAGQCLHEHITGHQHVPRDSFLGSQGSEYLLGSTSSGTGTNGHPEYAPLTADGRTTYPGRIVPRTSTPDEVKSSRSESARSFFSSGHDFLTRSNGGAIPVDPSPLEADAVPEGMLVGEEP